MFEAPGSDIVDVVITEEVVKGNAQPQYVMETSDNGNDSGYEEQEISASNP